MTVRERILSLRLMEREKRDPEYMKQLGVSVQMEHRPVFCQNEEGENRHVI